MTTTEHRLIRLLRLARLLQDSAPRGYRAPALAARMGVSVRTIYRDLLLVGAVFPVSSARGEWCWLRSREEEAA